MNRDSLDQLRLDRRLMRRKGWISSEELEAAMGDLPDSAAKATTLGEVEDSDKKKTAGNEAAPAS